mmetsp:Transcript_84912/g.168574  ORF Transcript_84912/g.168574 Transcript_84912/m.168574 type:complete len:234 (-) Transcript_84912:279-980(-)
MMLPVTRACNSASSPVRASNVRDTSRCRSAMSSATCACLSEMSSKVRVRNFIRLSQSDSHSCLAAVKSHSEPTLAAPSAKFKLSDCVGAASGGSLCSLISHGLCKAPRKSKISSSRNLFSMSSASAILLASFRRSSSSWNCKLCSWVSKCAWRSLSTFWICRTKLAMRCNSSWNSVTSTEFLSIPSRRSSPASLLGWDSRPLFSSSLLSACVCLPPQFVPACRLAISAISEET